MFFAVSIAFVVFLLGVGFAAAGPVVPKSDPSSRLEKIAFSLTTGLLANHLILLAVQSLQVSLWVGAAVAGCASVRILVRRRGRFRFKRDEDPFPLVMAVCVALLYYFTILIEPLEDWDARSIWFFHAKMIASAESIGLTAGWDHPSLRFSHADYPNLIPALAAQLSHVLGYWNEYMPKFSLFLVLIPPVFWVFSFWSRSFSFLLLALVFPFGLKGYLWSGSMDGYVALYAAVSMLLLGRYFVEGRMLDLMAGISCLAMAGNIKNEGILVGLIGVFAIAATGIWTGKLGFTALKKSFGPARAAWLAVVLVPAAVWSVFYKHKWGLANDLQLGSAAALHRMMNRLSDGVSFPLILKETLFNTESTVWLSLAAFAAGVILMTVAKRRTAGWMPALVTAGVYYGCMVTVFLLIPNDPTVHLLSSLHRTMLTTSGCLVVGAYFALREFEEAPPEPNPGLTRNRTSA